jgi:hypothetical protein
MHSKWTDAYLDMENVLGSNERSSYAFSLYIQYFTKNDLEKSMSDFLYSDMRECLNILNTDWTPPLAEVSSAVHNIAVPNFAPPSLPECVTTCHVASIAIPSPTIMKKVLPMYRCHDNGTSSRKRQWGESLASASAVSAAWRFFTTSMRFFLYR